MKYSEVIKENNRFIETADPNECKKWREELDKMLIRYTPLGKTVNNKSVFVFELKGYTKEENEAIKEMNYKLVTWY